MAGPGTVEVVSRLASQVLLPLGEALESPAALQDLLDDLGWEVPASLAGLGLDPKHVAALADALEHVLELRDGTPDDETVLAAYARLAAAVAAVAQDVHDLRGSLAQHVDAAFLAATGLAEELPRRLAEHLAVTWLAARSEPLLDALVLLGVVELLDVPRKTATHTSKHTRKIVHLDRLRTLVTDPVALLREVYGWGTPAARLPALVDRAAELGYSLGVPLELDVPPVERDAALAPGAVVPVVATQPELRLPLVRRRGNGAAAELGVSLYPLPPERPNGAPGLALGLFGAGELVEEIALDRFALWLLTVAATLDLKLGLMLVARPGQPLRLVDDLGGATHADGSVTVGVRRDVSPGEEIELLALGGSSVRAHGVRALAGVELRGGEPVLFVELGAEQGHATLSLGGADSFLASVLPAELADVAFDLGITWSTRDGLSLRGGAGLEATLAASAALGPVRLEALTLAATVGEHGTSLAAAVAVEVRLGPLEARVDGVGARLALTAPGSGGNLGPLDLRPGFEPPNGVGLALSAGPVSGGGYLFFDEQQEQYGGALQLEFSGIALKAVGVLTTRLPGRAHGFSLLVIVSAEFTPVQIGLGFTLDGVGGLLGINRTTAIEPLRAGLRSGTLAATLFPDDPVAHAQQLVAAIGTFFPPAAGRYVFGPTAKIGWGTPTLVTIDVALVLELPAPVRLIVVGRLRAVLPDEEAAVVRLQVDALGIVDFDRREASADATLVDSRLGNFALTGGLAMRVSWGAAPSFLLAVGGFNPRFQPPPGFPRLDRVAVALAGGDNPRLRLEAYLAVTSNTLQFGARLDLSVRAGSFTVAGLLAFDALMQQHPLSFVVDVVGSLAVAVGGHTLLSVTLKLTLSGPDPWHARGRASFSILFFDVSVSFDVTIGAPRAPALPEAVDVAPLLLGALRDRRAWTAQLPADGQALVTLRSLPPADGIFAHPHGTLQVRQRVVPLDRALDRFGGDVPSGARLFRIAGATLGDTAAHGAALDDLFAPAQFAALTDDQKLSQPSFVPMHSGVQLGEDDVVFGTPLDLELEFEQIVVGSAPPPAPEPEPERVLVGAQA